jgi:hypothetical protein
MFGPCLERAQRGVEGEETGVQRRPPVRAALRLVRVPCTEGPPRLLPRSVPVSTSNPPDTVSPLGDITKTNALVISNLYAALMYQHINTPKLG